MWSIILFSPTYPIEDNYCFLAFFAQQILVKKKKKVNTFLFLPEQKLSEQLHLY